MKKLEDATGSSLLLLFSVILVYTIKRPSIHNGTVLREESLRCRPTRAIEIYSEN